MKAADENIEVRLQNMRLRTPPGTDERILSDSFAALEASVRGRAERPTTKLSFAAHLRWFAAAAALIAIGLGLFWAARPDDPELRDVFRAVEKAENVGIERYLGGEDEPAQRLWVSRSLKMKLLENTTGPRAGYLFLDGERGVRAYRQASSDLVSRFAIPQDAVIAVRRSLTGSLGLVPFSDISLAGEEARWAPVADAETEAADIAGDAVAKDARVYDLIWKEQGQKHRVRFYLEPDTHFPARIERYASKAGENGERLEVADSVSIKTQTEIQDRIEYICGPIVDARDVRPTPPEYIGTPEEY